MSALTELEIADALFEMHSIITRILRVEIACNQNYYKTLHASSSIAASADFRDRVSLADKVILMCTGGSLKYAFEELNGNFSIAILLASSLIELMRLNIITVEFSFIAEKPRSFMDGDWVVFLNPKLLQQQDEHNAQHAHDQHKHNKQQHNQPILVHDDVMDQMVKHFYTAALENDDHQSHAHKNPYRIHTLYKWLKRFLALDTHTGDKFYIPTIPAHFIKAAKQKKIISNKKVPVLLIFSMNEYQADIEEQDALSQLLHEAIDCVSQASNDDEQFVSSNVEQQVPISPPALQGSISDEDLVIIQLFIELVNSGKNAADVSHLLAVNHSGEEEQDKKHHDNYQPSDKEKQKQMIKSLQVYINRVTKYYEKNLQKKQE